MNKTVLTLAIFAFCLFPQALSDDRELGSIGTINLGNIGTLLGGLIGSIQNTTNTTSSTNTTAPVTNTTSPVQNNTSTNTTVPDNTTAPVNNSTSTNTTAPVNTTVPTNTTAPVDNSTAPVNNSTSSTPVDNTTQPTNSTTPVDSGNTTTPVEPTPAPAPTVWYASNDVDRSAFKQKCLDIHNILRGAVGVAPLAWSDSLAASAQAWAENMALYGFRHSGRTGENIASTTYSTKVTVRLLGLWTKEQDWFIKGCVYPKCSSTGAEVGHYTQMVWAKTTQVGCGFAPGVNKQWNYLCCQYYRAGNVIGQTVFPYTAPTV